MKQSRDVILVAGSANIDVVVRAVHVPAPGETVLGRDLAVCPEGPASLSLPCAVVMLGSRGGCARDQDTSYLQPTFWIEAVNTTAAGDTFCGALASSLCAAIPLPQASRRASAAAALSTMRIESQSSTPTSDEVDALPRSHDHSRHGAMEDLAAHRGLKAARVLS
jgi:ribokinase